MNDGVPLQKEQVASKKRPFSAFAESEEEERRLRKFAVRQAMAKNAEIALYNKNKNSSVSTVGSSKPHSQEFLKLPPREGLPTSGTRQETIENNSARKAANSPQAEPQNANPQGKADAGNREFSRYQDIIKEGLRPKTPERSVEISNDAKAVVVEDKQRLLEERTSEAAARDEQKQGLTVSPESRTNVPTSVPLRTEPLTKFTPGAGRTGGGGPPPPIDPPGPPMGQASRSNSVASQELPKHNVRQDERLEDVRAQQDVTTSFQVGGTNDRGNASGAGFIANEVGGGALSEFSDRRNGRRADLTQGDISRIHLVDSKELVPPGQARGGKIVRDEASVRDNDANWMCITPANLQAGDTVILTFRSPVYIQMKALGEPRVDVAQMAKDGVSFVVENNNGKLTGAFYGQDGKRLEADQIPRIDAKGNERTDTRNQTASQSDFALPEGVLAIASARSPEAVRPNDRNEGGEKTFSGIKRAYVSEEREELVRDRPKRMRLEDMEGVRQIESKNWDTIRNKNRTYSYEEIQQAAAENKFLSALRGKENGYRLSRQMLDMFDRMSPELKDAIRTAYPEASLLGKNAQMSAMGPVIADITPRTLNARNTEVKALNPAQKGQVVGRVSKKGARGNVKDKRLVKARQRVASPPARSFQRSVSVGR